MLALAHFQVYMQDILNYKYLWFFNETHVTLWGKKVSTFVPLSFLNVFYFW